jgi:perosamine synthetase
MRHPRLGYNYRLDELSAALGCTQLDRLDEILDQRSAVADAYQDALAPLADDLHIPSSSDGDGTRSWFVYVVRLRDHFGETARDHIMEYLQSEGIGCAPYFPSIHLQPYHRDRLEHTPGDFPVCEYVSARTLALPFYAALSTSQIRRVAELLRDAISSLPTEAN